MPKFNFLKDAPLDKDGENFFNFYHSLLAPALKKILENETVPHTIGLFGSWGTGKSTIIEMISKDMEDIPVFVFDAWKYQHDALRRTFLIKLVDHINAASENKLDPDILKPLYIHQRRTSTVEDRVKDQTFRGKVARFIKHWWLLGLFILSLIAWVVLNIFLKQSHVVTALKDILGLISGVSFMTFILKPTIETVVKQGMEQLFRVNKDEIILRTQSDYEERFNSPEQFEEMFRQIMESYNGKMIIVFDNIDRVQGDVAISMLSTIKTFMDPARTNGLVFIIPCDPLAIEGQVADFYNLDKLEENNYQKVTSSDYLKKIFNLILWVPEFVSADLEEYTKKCLAATGEVGKLINNEDTILVINSAFSKNPREIIQFINNLIAVVITAQETTVKEIINNHIPYLAKVLVLRQKFPAAYTLLKEKWYSPEDIESYTPAGPTDKELGDFMNLTSRITVSDAEPFLYFKDPSQSRDLQDSEGLKTALIKGNTEIAAICVKKEANKDSAIDFMVDLILKYSDQEQVLLNVFTTHLEVLKEVGIVPQSKRYYDNLARKLDRELWRDYQQLPVEDIFLILSHSSLTPRLRTPIIGRYIQSLNSGGADHKFLLSLLASLKTHYSLLNSDHRTNLKVAIENHYAADADILRLFRDPKDQENFLTKKALTNFIDTTSYENISNNLSLLKAYREFILKQGLLDNLIQKLTERLRTENAITSLYSENKSAVIDCLPTVVEIFEDDLSSSEIAMTELSAQIIHTYNSTSTFEDRVTLLNGLWWIESHVSSQQNSEIQMILKNFVSSGIPEAPMKILEYWDAETRQNLISMLFDILLPRTTNTRPLLEYIYVNASDRHKKQILDYLIQNTPVDNPYDINFITTLDKLPNRVETLQQLLLRVGKFTYHSKTPYYDYISSNLRKGDPRDLKDIAINQMTSLIRTDNSSMAEVGFNFLSKSSFLSKTDLREVARGTLEWLREPGRVINERHRFAIQTVGKAFPELQPTLQQDYLYLLFKLLSPSTDHATVEVALNELLSISPTYKAYEKDFEDLLYRLESWPRSSTFNTVTTSFKNLKPSKLSLAQKKYWSKFDELLNTQP
jgi:hypothetical protein